MCGVVGYFTPIGQPQPLVDSLNSLRHRGPDDVGECSISCHFGDLYLGHRRLSIVDMSSAGRQPMSSSDGRFTIVFNGEIYNYKSLRDELLSIGYSFRSQSDTEVLIAAWSRWGIGALSRLVGMFAFAVFDRLSNSLTLARDAFGIKPLYIRFDDRTFGFASEIPALLELFQSPHAVNERVSYEYLVWGRYDDSEETFFKNVSRIPPGHYLEIKLPQLSTGRLRATPQRWWTPIIAENQRITFHEAVLRVRELFLSSVRVHLRSDVPVAIALSGGIDSASILCATRHIEPDTTIHSFSYVAKDSALNEERWIDIANDAVGAISHKIVLDESEVQRDLDDLIRCQGEPFGGTSIYAQYRVYRAMREEGFVVGLEGQGADEMFAGYHGFPGSRLRSLLDEGDWISAWRFLRRWAQWPGRHLSQGLSQAVSEVTGGSIYRALSRLTGRNPIPGWLNATSLRESGVCLEDNKQRPRITAARRRLVGSLLHTLTQQGLPALLRHGDRNSMHFSVESRVPFLTTDLASFALSLPESYLVSADGESKRVFRAAMRGIVPNEILNRRDKIGFKTPEPLWIRSILANSLRSDEIQAMPPIFNRKRLLAEFEAVIGGRRPPGEQAWRWINYIIWYHRFISPN